MGIPFWLRAFLIPRRSFVGVVSVYDGSSCVMPELEAKDRDESVSAALEIIRAAKSSVFTESYGAWVYLRRVEKYLEEQAVQAFNAYVGAPGKA